MRYKKTKTRFTEKIRIDKKQLAWIRENLGSYRTLAGKLDEIINFYRNNGIHHS